MTEHLLIGESGSKTTFLYGIGYSGKYGQHAYHAVVRCIQHTKEDDSEQKVQ